MWRKHDNQVRQFDITYFLSINSGLLRDLRVSCKRDYETSLIYIQGWPSYGMAFNYKRSYYKRILHCVTHSRLLPCTLCGINFSLLVVVPPLPPYVHPCSSWWLFPSSSYSSPYCSLRYRRRSSQVASLSPFLPSCLLADGVTASSLCYLFTVGIGCYLPVYSTPTSHLKNCY